MKPTLYQSQDIPVRRFINRQPTLPQDVALPWWCAKDAFFAPKAYMEACLNAEPTPLRELPELASALGIARLAAKDETTRLSLGNFKALGGAYAVFRFAQRKASNALGREVAPGQLRSEEVRAVLSGLTVCCATDGNHGRSVAMGAQLLGLETVVFLHAGVSHENEQAIQALGASIVRVRGSYEDSVHEARAAAATKGWVLVADTASESSTTAEMCGFVMQGYTVLLHEALEVPSTQPFTHVFIQAGVGGLAAVAMGHWTALQPNKLPKFVVVEPERSACLLESAIAGQLVEVADGEPTVMSMLECQRPSELAWPIISSLAHAFIAISDDDARRAKDCLLNPQGEDCPISAGESGVAGLAGLLRAQQDASLWQELQIGADSSVLIIITESARKEI